MDKALKSYGSGFVFCLSLTLLAYFTATRQLLSGRSLSIALAGLAILQAFLQLFFFLHLGQEPRPKWRLLMFAFMALVLLVIVLGTLWIMQNLNYRVMDM